MEKNFNEHIKRRLKCARNNCLLFRHCSTLESLKCTKKKKKNNTCYFQQQLILPRVLQSKKKKKNVMKEKDQLCIVIEVHW